MGTETNPQADILRLNALVDGELSPAERAEMAARIAADRDLARAHATLARLKGCIAERAEAAPGASMVLPPKRGWRLPLGLGAAIAAGGLVFLIVSIETAPQKKDVPIAARDAVIRLAALPSNVVVPDLGVAGLSLTDIDIDQSGPARFLHATYSGPHGCRLDLRVGPAEAAAQPMSGTSWRSWTVGGVTYELAAHGMPGWRFSLVAEAAERETRSGRLPDTIDRQLREARAGAPPCSG